MTLDLGNTTSIYADTAESLECSHLVDLDHVSSSSIHFQISASASIVVEVVGELLGLEDQDNVTICDSACWQLASRPFVALLRLGKRIPRSYLLVLALHGRSW